MLCLTALAGAAKAPEAKAACNLWLTRYYYPSAGSTVACGYTYFYCEAAAVHSGCTTAYFRDARSACSCQ